MKNNLCLTVFYILSFYLTGNCNQQFKFTSLYQQSEILRDTLPNDSLVHTNPNNLIKGPLIALDSLHTLWFVKQSLINDFNRTIIQNSQKEHVKFSEKEYSRKMTAIKSSIKFEINTQVKKYIDLYINSKPSQTEILIGLAKNYLPLFENKLKKNNLPDELKYLPLAESSLYNNTLTESGATGIWLLTYQISKLYGGHISSFVDERKDIIIATDIAAVYLKDLYKIYDDWLLAIAAYNSSPYTVNKAIRRAKGKIDFWSIYSYLPQENRDFVPAFIATVYILNYYKDFNLIPVMVKLPAEADTVVIYKQLHFKQVSTVLKLDINQIREMNPVYKLGIIPERSAGYKLLLPVGYSEMFYKFKDSIYKYSDSIIAPLMKVSDANIISDIKNEKVSKELIYYIVKPKDNITKIAIKYGVMTSEIKKWNHIKGNTVKKGQKLKIYYTTYEPKPNKKSDKKKTAKLNDTTKTPDKSINQQNNTDSNSQSKNHNPQSNDDFILYKVQEGDSFYKIAKNHSTTIKNILEFNNFDEDHIIKPGQKIKIPNF